MHFLSCFRSESPVQNFNWREKTLQKVFAENTKYSVQLVREWSDWNVSIFTVCLYNNVFHAVHGWGDFWHAVYCSPRIFYILLLTVCQLVFKHGETIFYTRMFRLSSLIWKQYIFRSLASYFCSELSCIIMTFEDMLKIYFKVFNDLHVLIYWRRFFFRFSTEACTLILNIKNTLVSWYLLIRIFCENIIIIWS
jgi:hypothetical protein